MNTRNRYMVTNISDFYPAIHAKAIKVIAITAGKGGVGKSHISINLAISLAKRNKKIMLLDGDLGLGNLDIMLGLHSEYDLSHVLAGTCALNDIVVQGPHGISVIPASSGCNRMASLSSIEQVGIINAFNELTNEIDYLIIDTATGISETVLGFTRSSQHVMVILSDEPASLAKTYGLIKVMHQVYGWKRFYVLANMMDNARDGLRIFQKLDTLTEQFLDVYLEYIGALPFDARVREAAKQQQVVLSAFPDSPFSNALEQLATKVALWPTYNQSSGNTRFFMERAFVG